MKEQEKILTLNEHPSKDEQEAGKNYEQPKQSVPDKIQKIPENYSDVLKISPNHEEEKKEIYKDKTTFNHFEIKKNGNIFVKIQNRTTKNSTIN